MSNAPKILKPHSGKTPDAPDKGFKTMIEFVIQTLEYINADAEADMLAGNKLEGAHHRAIEKTLAELKEGLNKQ